MTIEKETLIEDLIFRTKENLNGIENFKGLNPEALNWRQSAESWSVLECIEHLNLYGDFYLPEIQKRIERATPSTKSILFKSGLLGNYFANMMLPGKKRTKIKTFKDKNPLGSTLGPEVLGKFTEQQKNLLDLLKKARQVDLNKVKTSISLSSLFKLKLGDTFRVVVYHNQRHLEQANRVVQAMESIRR